MACHTAPPWRALQPLYLDHQFGEGPEAHREKMDGVNPELWVTFLPDTSPASPPRVPAALPHLKKLSKTGTEVGVLTAGPFVPRVPRAVSLQPVSATAAINRDQNHPGFECVKHPRSQLARALICSPLSLHVQTAQGGKPPPSSFFRKF